MPPVNIFCTHLAVRIFAVHINSVTRRFSPFDEM